MRDEIRIRMAEQAVADAFNFHARDYKRTAFDKLMYVVAVARPPLGFARAAHERAGSLPVEL